MLQAASITKIPYNQIFHWKLFLRFGIYPSRGGIFVEEKFAYRRSIKKLTVPGEDLFSARPVGV